MCGIAGWLVSHGVDLHQEHAAQLGRALRHRGPDDAGVHLDTDKGLALVHQRLSIVDLSEAGRQPMVHPHSGDVLIYNGEIYNHHALREELHALGCEFASLCDTEVLLHALHQWGFDALKRIHGMYAFAYWQAATDTLHLVRDPLGIKPLYYWLDPVRGGIVFASEVKALREFPGYQARIDERSLQQYIEFGYSFDRERTLFAELQKLPPGNRLTLTNGHSNQTLNGQSHEIIDYRATTPTMRPLGDYQKIQSELHHTLEQVVAEHLRADVPLALLLSGGLDSSLLAAYAAQQTKLKTLTFCFANSAVDERPYARAVSDHVGTDHEEIVVAPEHFVDHLDNVSHCFDDLFADWGLFSTHLLYRQCQRRGIKVVIVGEGADELFGGYHSVFSAAAKPTSLIPLEWQLFQLYRRYIGARYGQTFTEFRAQMQRFLRATQGDLFAAIRLFECCCQLPNNYVMKVDKASMAASIEARVPYLDTRVSAIANTLPKEMLINHGATKQVLRDMASRFNLLPESVINRDKFGASIALSWMDDDHAFRSYAQSVILSPGGWTDRLRLRSAMVAYFRGGRTGYTFPHRISIFRNLAWRLLMLTLWSRHFALAP